MVANKYLSKLLVDVKLIGCNIAWCAKVIVTPEDNNKIVLTRGKPQTSKDWMLFGGQIPPIAIDGDKLTWKKAQKKAKKNIISETIKRIIPKRSPWRTANVWYPWLDSETTVKNQANNIVENINQAIWKPILSKKWSGTIPAKWR